MADLNDDTVEYVKSPESLEAYLREGAEQEAQDMRDIDTALIKATGFDAIWDLCVELGMEVHPPGVDEDGETIDDEWAYQFGFLRGLAADRAELLRIRTALADKEREWREQAARFSELSSDMLTNEGEALASVKVATLLQAADELAAMKGGDRE